MISSMRKLEEVLGKYFLTKRYKSFTRQLYLHDFQRDQEAKEIVFSNIMFRRGNTADLVYIQKTKIKKDAKGPEEVRIASTDDFTVMQAELTKLKEEYARKEEEVKRVSTKVEKIKFDKQQELREKNETNQKLTYLVANILRGKNKDYINAMKQNLMVYSQLSSKSKNFGQYRQELEKELQLKSLLDHYASDVCRGFGYLFHSKSGSRTSSEILDTEESKRPRERSASANKKNRVTIPKDKFFTIISYAGKAK